MAGPAIVAGLAANAPKMIGDAASGVANSGQYGAETTTTMPVAPEATGQTEVEATKELPVKAQEAATGLQKAAETEKKIVVPAASQTAQSGLQTQRAGIEQQQLAITNYKTAVEEANQKAIDTEGALQQAAESAKIDPQRYINNLGVGQKTLTAIGIALSGLGAGLTGQPNMAMQAVQANIDRDIQAQAKIFQNKMETVAAERGLLQSAQDRQNLAQLALQQATVMVTTGANTAIQGIQSQVAGAVAPDMVAQMVLKNQQATAEAISNINTKYVQMIKSGNTKQVNQLGLALDTAAEQLNGTGLGINKNPAEAARSQSPNNAIFKQPESMNSPLNNIFNSETAKRENAASMKPQESFLDAMAKAGRK